MNQSFINKLSALVITSLVLIIGLVLLKSASLPEVTVSSSEDHVVVIYEDIR